MALRQPPGEGGDPSGRGCPARRQTKCTTSNTPPRVSLSCMICCTRSAHGKGSRLVGAAHFESAPARSAPPMGISPSGRCTPPIRSRNCPRVCRTARGTCGRLRPRPRARSFRGRGALGVQAQIGVSHTSPRRSVGVAGPGHGRPPPLCPAIWRDPNFCTCSAMGAPMVTLGHHAAGDGRRVAFQLHARAGPDVGDLRATTRVAPTDSLPPGDGRGLMSSGERAARRHAFEMAVGSGRAIRRM